MDVVHRSTVTEDMIDSLGHMNVRFYGMFADRATRALLAAAEVVRPDHRVQMTDMYTRHHREQMAGAELAVRSGFVELNGSTATLYHELFNTATEVLAATFIRRVDLVGESASSPSPSFLHSSVTTVAVPEHGQPRTLSLETDLLARAPTVEHLRDRGLAMRRARRVGLDECGPDGVLDPDRIQELFWTGEPVDRRSWDMRHTADDGAPVSMAVVESRTVVGARPHAGDEIQSFGAVVALGDKTTTRQSWVFDLTTGKPLVVSASVGLALDLDARRAVSLPVSLRTEMESVLARDLA